jgi:hypothetical protein
MMTNMAHTLQAPTVPLRRRAFGRLDDYVGANVSESSTGAALV